MEIPFLSKGDARILLSRVAWWGRELTILPRKVFVRRMIKDILLSRIFHAWLPMHIAKPQPVKLEVQEHLVFVIDFAAQPCRLDSMHHTGSQGTHPSHKIF